jgi:hypothetical protein
MLQSGALNSRESCRYIAKLGKEPRQLLSPLELPRIEVIAPTKEDDTPLPQKALELKLLKWKLLEPRDECALLILRNDLVRVVKALGPR